MCGQPGSVAFVVGTVRAGLIGEGQDWYRFLADRPDLDAKALEDTLGEQLAPASFRRRSGSWYRTGAEMYIVVNIQRSRWDDALYVNVGITPTEGGIFIACREDRVSSPQRQLKIDCIVLPLSGPQPTVT